AACGQPSMLSHEETSLGNDRGDWSRVTAIRVSRTRQERLARASVSLLDETRLAPRTAWREWVCWGVSCDLDRIDRNGIRRSETQASEVLAIPKFDWFTSGPGDRGSGEVAGGDEIGPRRALVLQGAVEVPDGRLADGGIPVPLALDHDLLARSDCLEVNTVVA